MNTLCIYHANCFDGMAAAWVVKRFYPDAVCTPMQYGQDIIMVHGAPAIINKETRLLIVDFSFPRERMEALMKSAGEFLCLDHHKTARANLEGLPNCVFDMDQSGAGLAWRYLFPNDRMPKMIQYIEDRDLWRFKLPNSEEVNAYIQTYPIEMQNYDVLYAQLESTDGYWQAAHSGLAVERYKATMVASICKHARLENVGGYVVPTVQAGILFSEIGHYLASHTFPYPDPNGHPADRIDMIPQFGASWFIRSDGVKVYSLRSIGDFDVSEVAKRLGGGGHKNAAGFQVTEVATV